MPDPTYESEWLTRKKRIDTRLRALGWQIVPFDAAMPLSSCMKLAIEEFPTDTGPADYALCVNGRILGIVEAKKLSLGPQNVLVQWGTDALSELRTKLAATKERFTVDNLQKVHAAAYGKSLVDIMSMVKHAAKDEEPLLTAAERVDRAMDRITKGEEFNEEQQRWLGRIRAHLIENLSIDREDFEVIPIFSREGGWGKANRVFGDQLAGVIKELNEAMAA